MTRKWEMDEQIFREFHEMKEQRRLAAKKPPPSIEAREEAFAQRFVKAALENALAKLSAADRELIRIMIGSEPGKSIASLARERGCDPSVLYRQSPLILLELFAVLQRKGD